MCEQMRTEACVGKRVEEGERHRKNHRNTIANRCEQHCSLLIAVIREEVLHSLVRNLFALFSLFAVRNNNPSLLSVSNLVNYLATSVPSSARGKFCCVADYRAVENRENANSRSLSRPGQPRLARALSAGALERLHVFAVLRSLIIRYTAELFPQAELETLVAR